MQLLRLVSSIASRGKVFNPHMVKMILTPQGNVKRKIKPELKHAIEVSGDILDNIIEGMRRVAEYGTAQYLNVDMEVAAKTGTAQSPDGEDHAWFACFAPISEPEVAIVVLVEHGGYGSTAAMPVARKMLKERFNLR